MPGPWEKFAQKSPEAGPWTKFAQPELEKPTATMGPQPDRGMSGWFEDVGNDLLHGGSRTIVGRALGHMQGEGDKGYAGLESGVSPETAEFMGSVPLGITKMAQGGAEVTEGHPLTGAGHIIQGGLQAATIPSSFIAPEAAGTGSEIASVLHIPNKAHASRMLGEVANAAQDVPVMMEQTEPALEGFRDFVKTGGKNSPVMMQLRNRIAPRAPKMGILERMQSEVGEPLREVPEPEPINFPEARKFYTNVSRATAKPGFLRQAIEAPGMSDMRRNAGAVREALNQDLTRAAEQVGMGDKYTDAIREYARAAKLDKGLKMAGTVAAEEALRRSGILGKMAAGAANVVK